ncbi:MAG: PadR family transcriptional regulator [Anaerolineales bacterium]
MNGEHNELTLEYILLGLLQGQPLHGYALYRKLRQEQELSRIWQVKRSKMYYLLEKLEEKNLLTSEFVHNPSRPDRKMYRVTEKGQREYRSWMKSPVESGRHMRIAFLSRLFFAVREGEDRALALVDKQISLCRSWKESLESQLGDLQDPDFITRQIFHFRIGQVQAMLDWLRSCQEGIVTRQND